MEITGKERAFLRSLANRIEATVQIGKGGIGENTVTLVNDILEKKELVKVHVLENCFDDVASVCHELSSLIGAAEVQVIGSKFVLYKPSVQNKRIDLKHLVVKVDKNPAKAVKPLYKAKKIQRTERKKALEEKERKRAFFKKQRYKSGFGRD